MTQNVIFHIKSHVTKHEFWGLLIHTKITDSHVTTLDMKWNMKWYMLKKLGDWSERNKYGEQEATKSKEQK